MENIYSIEREIDNSCKCGNDPTQGNRTSQIKFLLSQGL